MMIKFNIREKSYQAEKNMTWREWVDSPYNIDSYDYGQNQSILHIDGIYIVYLNKHGKVRLHEKIIDNQNYSLLDITGNDGEW